MAITAYTGFPGTGKSFALVAEVIVPGVKDGRRVLTNVSGVDGDKIADYVRTKWPNLGPIGSVVTFTGEQTLEPGFFPVEGEPDRESFVKPGDLFVFDEVRMFWPRRGRFSQEIMKFIRYHRHFVDHDTGQSTDMVFCSQIATDFHEDFRGCIERSYKFKRLKTLGLSKVYVWSMWEGAEQRKGQEVSNGRGVFRNEISDLYSSYQGTKGVESGTDKRENVLSNKKLWGVIAGVILMVLVASWSLWKMFHPAKPEPAVAASVATPNGLPAIPPGVSTPAPVATVNNAPPASSVWRIAGVIQTPALYVVVLVDRSGNSRYEDPSNFTMVDGRPYVGVVDGQRVFAIGMQSAASGSNNVAGPSLFGRPTQ